MGSLYFTFFSRYNHLSRFSLFRSCAFSSLRATTAGDQRWLQCSRQVVDRALTMRRPTTISSAAARRRIHNAVERGGGDDGRPDSTRVDRPSPEGAARRRLGPVTGDGKLNWPFAVDDDHLYLSSSLMHCSFNLLARWRGAAAASTLARDVRRRLHLRQVCPETARPSPHGNSIMHRRKKRSNSNKFASSSVSCPTMRSVM